MMKQKTNINLQTMNKDVTLIHTEESLFIYATQLFMRVYTKFLNFANSVLGSAINRICNVLQPGGSTGKENNENRNVILCTCFYQVLYFYVPCNFYLFNMSDFVSNELI